MQNQDWQTQLGMGPDPMAQMTKHGGSIRDGVWVPPLSYTLKYGGHFVDGFYEPPLQPFNQQPPFKFEPKR